MDIVGNLLVVKDYSSLRASLFIRRGEHYELLFGTDQEYDFAGNLESLYNSEKTPYLYFQKNSLARSAEAGKPLSMQYIRRRGRLPGSRWTVIQNIHFLTGSIWMRAGIFCCYTGKTRTGRNSEHIG